MLRARGNGGQATLEVALCLPLVAVVLAGALETGLVALDHVRVWHAAREAARIATVSGDLDDVRAAAARAGVDPDHLEISPDLHYRTAGDPVTVSLRERREGRVPLIGLLFRLSIEAEATMRIETP